MEEELEILRASGSAGVSVLITDSLDESLYCKRRVKDTKNIPCTISSGCRGIDSSVFQTQEIVPETVVLLGKDVEC